MASVEEQVSALSGKLREALLEMNMRLTSVQAISQAEADHVRASYGPVIQDAEDTLEKLREWEGTKARLFGKKQAPTEALEAGERALQGLSAGSEVALEIVKAPTLAAAALAASRGKISINEQLLGPLETRGADTTTARMLIHNVTLKGAHADALMEEGDYLAALALAKEAGEESTRLAKIVREEQVAVDSLAEDYKKARVELKRVNALAQLAAAAAGESCPAASESLWQLGEGNRIFNETLALLENYNTAQPAKGATTVMRQVLAGLAWCSSTLEEVKAREDLRNKTWSESGEIQEQIASLVVEVARKNYPTEKYWDELDRVAGLLARGEVFEVVAAQKELLQAVKANYLPAISATSFKDEEEAAGPAWQAEQQGGAWEHHLEIETPTWESHLEIEAPPRGWEEAEAGGEEAVSFEETATAQAPVVNSLDELRAMVRSMSQEIQDLRTGV